MKKLLFIFLSCLTTSCCIAQKLSTKAVLSNSSFSFEKHQAGHFNYYYAKDSEVERKLDSVIELHESRMTRILQILKLNEYTELIDYFIVRDLDELGKLTGDTTVQGKAIPEEHLMFAYMNAEANSIGGHEIMHIVVRDIWGKTRYGWMEEGMASYSDEKWRPTGLHNLANQLAKDKKLVSFSHLLMYHLCAVEVRYWQTGSIVKYLCEQYGIEKVRQLWKKGLSKAECIFGKDRETLEREWREHIKGHDDTVR